MSNCRAWLLNIYMYITVVCADWHMLRFTSYSVKNIHRSRLANLFIYEHIKNYQSRTRFDKVRPIAKLTRSTATAEMTRHTRNDCSRSLKVIQKWSRWCCCANGRGIYDFLLAPNSNLTSIFNRSWDITPSLHIHTLPLFQLELEKRRLRVGGHALVSRCPEHWTIQP